MDLAYKNYLTNNKNWFLSYLSKIRVTSKSIIIINWYITKYDPNGGQPVRERHLNDKE